MTNEELKNASDLSNDISRMEHAIKQLKTIPKWKLDDFDNAVFKDLVYKYKDEIMPIFERHLKECKEKFNSL